MFENLYPLHNFDFLKCRKITVAILSIVKAITIYAKVPHSELFTSVFSFQLASTSFVLYNIKLTTIILICLCLQNKYITNIIVTIELWEQ